MVVTKYTPRTYTKSTSTQGDQKMFYLRCTRDNHNLETFFDKRRFPPEHKLHGVDYNNKLEKHQIRDYYNKGRRNNKGKHQSYNTISIGDNEDPSSNNDNSKDTPDGVFITRDKLASILSQGGFTKNEQPQAHMSIIWQFYIPQLTYFIFFWVIHTQPMDY